jgi:hypothetical protein
MGVPDVALRMPVEFTVAADRMEDTQEVTLATGTTETRSLRARPFQAQDTRASFGHLHYEVMIFDTTARVLMAGVVWRERRDEVVPGVLRHIPEISEAMMQLVGTGSDRVRALPTVSRQALSSGDLARIAAIRTSNVADSATTGAGYDADARTVACFGSRRLGDMDA